MYGACGRADRLMKMTVQVNVVVVVGVETQVDDDGGRLNPI